MPIHAEKRRSRHTPDQLFALVADVERYPEFLPWTAAVRVRARAPLREPDAPSGGEVLDADMVVSFKVFREQFGSRVVLRPTDHSIDVTYIDGPFRHLENRWRFLENDDGGATIDFFIDFEFKNLVLQKLIGAVFGAAITRVVSAFERRADALYGDVDSARVF